ncbi:putative NADH:ubiquinone reductase (non-electrogenic) [Helianthus annuus]|uniref:NADH:ubiquinone reductase (Non-electrogenic) n=1 Tax=Helianthus annuus TaxID=4232 RepID=A0A251SFB3_HELAN|nr:ferroptosis suppressor protein 1 [Helianthus annuus]KAF5767836.1 putative NADH:ubiquinone reductase (non-electrogenic) [Helianthus annuus]KAJ0467205.1 putative NADH:ubiquinone reductase (non-electrogenic) [Helianthus annuus]KAJ0484662.1 putative NADH:ubiquinone reductase (non-electrogenic) [Helianthus annuus]KAJ0630602.1 putative NADH:ubiquinone reductase (non-electrogenic) [Helianthus annuus]KAJ0655216.1 putative NADH:ubiquinone reductase (non-electrogenic) [Helianthus annuus]
MANPKVVVIGGGIAGSYIAKSLQFHSNLTLIDPKEYLEIPWASLRGMVEPGFAERSLIQHKDYLTGSRLIVSNAVDIRESEVLTSEGRLIPYDYLVIATGHGDPLPKTRADRLKQYQAENEKIKAAQSILIVGGGPTGVELAGEIAVDFPEKKMTLVHNGYRLLEFLGPKASKKTLDWLTSRRVEVKLEQTVNLEGVAEEGSKVYKTSAGEIIRADCLFLCTGKPLASSWLKNTILGDSLDDNGSLVVDGNLRVKGRKNIFAVGDITNIKEMKQGHLAKKQASAAAKNLKLVMNGGSESKMVAYKVSSTTKAIVSLGRHDAVAQLHLTTMIGLVPGLLKSKDLYVGKTRKELDVDSFLLH